MIATALTEMFGLEQPIVLAPMGSVAGGSLAAAVSNAGGLGLIGGGYGDPAFLRAELARVREATQRPWGVGFITWSMRPETLALALEARPQAVMLSFGDPRPHVEAIKAAGCKLICQVQDVHDALAAREAGADLIVAQGTEAGGHGATRATLPLVPVVVDAVAPLPVVAAGGIADGRGLAAALMLGAQGALIGTRFYAATESLASAEAKARIVAAEARQTERTRAFDVVRGYDWPSPYTGRALRNAFTARWQGREEALAAALASERPRYWRAAQDGDHDTAVVWAGEAVDLIERVVDAAAIVAELGDDAARRLRAGAACLR